MISGTLGAAAQFARPRPPALTCEAVLSEACFLLRTVPEADKDPIMNVVFDTMLDEGTPATSIEVIAEDCVMITQDFVPMLLSKTETARSHIRFRDGAMADIGRMVH